MRNNKNDAESGISMEEIERRIDEMPVFDLRDPRHRKQHQINIGAIVDSLNLEALMRDRLEDDVKNIDKNAPSAE